MLGFELLAGVFGTYYLALALTEKDGPFGWFFRLRQRFELMNCFTCMSFWTGLGISFALFGFDLQAFIFGIGLAGAATIMWMIVNE